MTTIPIDSVAYRTGAIPSLEMVNAFSSAASKVEVPPWTDLQVLLDVQAWVYNADFTKNVWVDVHVFDGADQIIRSETLPLRYLGPAGGGGDFFAFNTAIFKGRNAGPGWVSFAPDARKVQYRLYYEVNGKVFSDGLLRQEDLPSDDAMLNPARSSAVTAGQPQGNPVRSTVALPVG